MYGILLLVLMIPLLAVVLDSSIARAIAKRLEGGAGGGLSAEERRRLSTLEGEVERLSDELERVREQSEFLERLLEERAPRDALPPGRQPSDETRGEQPGATPERDRP